MLYLDLAEVADLVGRGKIISERLVATCSFRREDHLFDQSIRLDDEVRHLIVKETGLFPSGPIRMLTQLRYFGYYMSPLNLYFVFDDERRVEFIVAEVNNTPWNERHCYVLWEGNRHGERTQLEFSHPKSFHVSPFMNMEMEYLWKLTEPGRQLHVGLQNIKEDTTVFNAGMTLKRRPLTQNSLRWMTLRYPIMTARITWGIYLQALKLWMKKCPIYPHPKNVVPPAIPAKEP